MAEKLADLLLGCLIACTTLWLVSSLNLEFAVTQPPRHPRTTPPSQAAPVAAAAAAAATTTGANGTKAGPKAAVATTATKGVVLYRVAAPNGATCILLKTDGLVEVYFKTHGDDDMAETYMSDDAVIEGNCRYEDTASMRISWDGYTLIWNFAKTPGGERWYVSQLELTVSTALERYHSIRFYGKSFKLIHTQMLFPTPVGKSFACEESVVDLSVPEGAFNPSGLSAKLFLRTFQLQPFMYKGNSFGAAFDCNARLAFRDETAPIAVGSTLAIAVLATVTGYGIFRYFKIKKVQYNTME